MQVSFAGTTILISTFVFTTRIEQFLYFLNPKFQSSSHLLWMYSWFYVESGRKPRRPSSRDAAHLHNKKCFNHGTFMYFNVPKSLTDAYSSRVPWEFSCRMVCYQPQSLSWVGSFCVSVHSYPAHWILHSPCCVLASSIKHLGTGYRSVLSF